MAPPGALEAVGTAAMAPMHGNRVLEIPGCAALSALSPSPSLSSSSSLLGRLLCPAAPPPAADGPQQVRASHLLVKHRDSRRPSSWKEPNVTRSKVGCDFGIAQLHQTLGSLLGSPAQPVWHVSYCCNPAPSLNLPCEDFCVAFVLEHLSGILTGIRSAAVAPARGCLWGLGLHLLPEPSAQTPPAAA